MKVETEHAADTSRYGVIMPYSSNIDEAGNPYLSIFSFEAVRVAHQLYLTREIDKLVLCGETPFGSGKPSTTALMQEMLEKLKVPKEDIVITPGENLNNTPIQLQAVAQEQHRQHLGTNPLTVITWGYHEQRVKNHMKGFGITGETVTVDSVVTKLTPYTAGTIAEMEASYLQTEKRLRRLSRFDKKGRVTTLLTSILGARVMDRHYGEYINTTAVKRRSLVVAR